MLLNQHYQRKFDAAKEKAEKYGMNNRNHPLNYHYNNTVNAANQNNLTSVQITDFEANSSKAERFFHFLQLPNEIGRVGNRNYELIPDLNQLLQNPIDLQQKWNAFLKKEHDHSAQDRSNLGQTAINRLLEQNPGLLPGIQETLGNVNTLLYTLQTAVQNGIIPDIQGAINNTDQTIEAAKRVLETINDNNVGIPSVTAPLRDAIANLNTLLQDATGDSNNSGLIDELRTGITNFNKAFQQFIKEGGTIENLNKLLTSVRTFTNNINEQLTGLDTANLSAEGKRLISAIRQNIPRINRLIENATALIDTYNKTGQNLNTALDAVQKNAENISANVRYAVHGGMKFAADFKDSIKSTANTVKKAIVVTITLFFLFIFPIIFPALIAGPIYIALSATFLALELFMLFAAPPFLNVANNLKKNSQYKKDYIQSAGDWFLSTDDLKTKRTQRQRNEESEKLREEREKQEQLIKAKTPRQVELEKKRDNIDKEIQNLQTENKSDKRLLDILKNPKNYNIGNICDEEYSSKALEENIENRIQRILKLKCNLDVLQEELNEILNNVQPTSSLEAVTQKPTKGINKSNAILPAAND